MFTVLVPRFSQANRPSPTLCAVPELHLHCTELLQVITELEGPQDGILLSEHNQGWTCQAAVDIQAKPVGQQALKVGKIEDGKLVENCIDMLYIDCGVCPRNPLRYVSPEVPGVIHPQEREAFSCIPSRLTSCPVSNALTSSIRHVVFESLVSKSSN